MATDSNRLPEFTEEEERAYRAQRERNDKISALMGQKLLKRWKMLATSCDRCGCILMQDLDHKDYCIGCEEIDPKPETPGRQSERHLGSMETPSGTPLRQTVVGRARTMELTVTPVQTWDNSAKTNSRITGPAAASFSAQTTTECELSAEDVPVSQTVSMSIVCVERKLRAATAAMEQCAAYNYEDLKAAAKCVGALTETLHSLLKVQQRYRSTQ